MNGSKMADFSKKMYEGKVKGQCFSGFPFFQCLLSMGILKEWVFSLQI